MLDLKSKWHPIAALAVFIAFFHLGCARKSNVNLESPINIKIAFMPFNVPENNKDLRWTAMAAPILMAKVSKQSQDFELIPFWQSMPVAIQKAGRSRSFTPDAVAEASVWLSAKWTSYGEFTPTKTGVSMMIDFIPNKDNITPFRYIRSGRMDWIESGVHQAFEQFLRYLSGHPLEPERGLKDLSVYRNLAEALDREYGWFVDAEPGKSKEAVDNLVQTDPQLARFLFSPTMYPALNKK
jgi:hypothetical protein